MVGYIAPHNINYAPPLKINNKAQEIAKELGVQLLKITNCYNGCNLKTAGLQKHGMAIWKDNELDGSHKACFNMDIDLDKLFNVIRERQNNKDKSTTTLITSK